LEPLISLIKYYEGCLLTPYRDPIGLWTVGWGHLISTDRSLKEPPTITLEEANVLLRKDVNAAVRLTLGLLERSVDPWLLMALTDFTFNLGSGNLKASTLLRKVNRGEPEQEIIAQFARWNKAGGRVLPGLTKRRASEVMLLLTGGFDPKQVNKYIDIMLAAA